MSSVSNVAPINVFCNYELNEAVGDPISVVFKVSDTEQYQITAPKEFLMTASGYFSGLIDSKCKEAGMKEIEVDVQQLIQKPKKEVFEHLAYFIHAGGCSKPTAAEQMAALTTIDDFKGMYRIVSYLDMQEVKEFAELQIVELMHDSERSIGDRSSWPDCLCFGINQRSSVIVEAAFRYLNSDYERSIRSNTKTRQYVSNQLALIKKSVSLIKNAEEASETVEKAEGAFAEFIEKKQKHPHFS